MLNDCTFSFFSSTFRTSLTPKTVSASLTLKCSWDIHLVVTHQKFSPVKDLDVVSSSTHFAASTSLIHRIASLDLLERVGTSLLKFVLHILKPPTLGQASHPNFSVSCDSAGSSLRGFSSFNHSNRWNSRTGDFTRNTWARSSGRSPVDGLGFPVVTNQLGSNPAVRVVLSVLSLPVPYVIRIRLRLLHRNPLIQVVPPRPFERGPILMSLSLSGIRSLPQEMKDQVRRQDEMRHPLRAVIPPVQSQHNKQNKQVAGSQPLEQH